jgi:hypothetical protein
MKGRGEGSASGLRCGPPHAAPSDCLATATARATTLPPPEPGSCPSAVVQHAPALQREVRTRRCGTPVEAVHGDILRDSLVPFRCYALIWPACGRSDEGASLDESATQPSRGITFSDQDTYDRGCALPRNLASNPQCARSFRSGAARAISSDRAGARSRTGPGVRKAQPARLLSSTRERF